MQGPDTTPMWNLLSPDQAEQREGDTEMSNFTLKQHTMTCTGQHIQTQVWCWCDTEITTRVVTQQCSCSLWRCNIRKGFRQHSWHIQFKYPISAAILPQLLWLHTNPDCCLCDAMGSDLACVNPGKKLSPLIHRPHHTLPTTPQQSTGITWWAELLTEAATPEGSLQGRAMNSTQF